jgi:hypothetical protein
VHSAGGVPRRPASDVGDHQERPSCRHGTRRGLAPPERRQPDGPGRAPSAAPTCSLRDHPFGPATGRVRCRHPARPAGTPRRRQPPHSPNPLEDDPDAHPHRQRPPDPHSRAAHHPSGKSVTKLSIASDRRDRDAAPGVIDVVLWNAQAEAAVQHLSKARPSRSPAAPAFAPTPRATGAPVPPSRSSSPTSSSAPSRARPSAPAAPRSTTPRPPAPTRSTSRSDPSAAGAPPAPPPAPLRGPRRPP